MSKENEKTKLVEVEAKKRGIAGKKITLTVNKKDLPEGVDYRDVVAAHIVKSNREKEEQSEKKDKKPSKGKLLIVGIVALALPLLLSQCKGEAEVTRIESTPISGIVYQLDDPSLEAWLSTGALGQEQMTNNEIENGSAFNGDYYDYNEQAEKEAKSIDGHEDFKTYRSEFDSCMEALKNPEISKEEKENALRKLGSISKEMDSMYKSKASIIDENDKDFKEATEINADSRTETEKAIMDSEKGRYYDEMGLSKANIDFINDVIARMEAGEEINFSSIVQQLDGDYVIQGESCKKFVEKQQLKGIKAAVHNIKSLFTKDKDKQETQEVSQEEFENEDPEK